RHPPRHDLPLQHRGPAALPRLRDSWPDRDSAPLPQPVRATARGRALLPPRHPSADRATHTPREGRLSGQGARPRWLPDLRARLPPLRRRRLGPPPPLRRRRLGGLPLPWDVPGPHFGADHRPDPPAAALPPDLPGPELRHL